MGFLTKNFKLKILILAFFVAIVTGCDTKPTCDSTYFGGKIINPKSDYVVLYKNEISIDTFLFK